MNHQSIGRVITSGIYGVAGTAVIGGWMGGFGGALIGPALFGGAGAVVGAASHLAYHATSLPKPVRAVFAGLTSAISGAITAATSEYFFGRYAACRTDYFDYNNCITGLTLYGALALPVGMFAVVTENLLANRCFSESKNISNQNNADHKHTPQKQTSGGQVFVSPNSARATYSGFFERSSDLDTADEKRVPALERRSNAIYRP